VETHIFPEQEIQKFSKEGMELWEKYFAPHIQSSSDAAGQKVLEIPVNWFNFITLMLLTPEKFDWAKKLLNSALWNVLMEDERNSKMISFIIPEKCTVSKSPKCSLSELENPFESLQDAVAPPSAPKRKRRGKGPLVENEVRRSPRIQEINNGFKSHYSCSDKNCLTCTAMPPAFRPKIVKNLASSFCKVEDENLEAKLSRKGKRVLKEKENLAADGNSQKSKGSSKN
jgi:hypothetical protein